MLKKMLVVCFAFFAFTLFGNIASAQSLSYVSQVGTVNGSLAVNVQGNVFDTGVAGLPPQISGSIDISGYIGDYGVSISANVATVSFDTTVVSGQTYSRVKITSDPFVYVDLTTRIRTISTIQITIVKKLKGTITFQVVSFAEGVTLSATGNSAGELVPITITSGNTTIHVATPH